MVCAPVRSIIPSLSSGIISPHRHTNHALSLILTNIELNDLFYGVVRLILLRLVIPVVLSILSSSPIIFVFQDFSGTTTALVLKFGTVVGLD